MNMPKISLVVGILLVVQGVGFYVGTSSRSITALIPAFVGLPILVLGIVALKESARKHAMHVAAALAMLGFLAAVGRMAFSLYILQTLVCTTIFFGHGLGLYGRVERVGQIAIVAAVTLLQLWIAPLWLTRYRYGPLEWIWRTLTYMRPQPFKR